jgi:tetratricopeptide (TPR) repeat protein
VYPEAYTWPISASKASDIAGQSVTMHVIREGPLGSRRLDSWKEIAAFFGRDERTVKRWEKEKGLPVHRLPENTGARVFAFTDELTQWMNSPEPANSKGIEEERHSVTPAEISPATAPAPPRPSRTWVALASVVALLAGASFMLAYRYNKSRTNEFAGSTPARTSANASAPIATGPHVVSDPMARDLYLKGRYHWEKRTPDDLNTAISYFNQAIARDPRYPQAYVGLANCYSLLREFSAMPSETAFPKALAAARKAIELDDSSAEAHTALAQVTFYWNWDAAGAEREFLRAIELDPKYVTAHHWYATFLMIQGRYPGALEQIDLARQLDPGSTAILSDKALILFHQGDRDEAVPLLKQLSGSQPDFFSTHQYLSYIYLDDGDYPSYLAEASKAAALSHNAQEMEIVRAAENGYHSGGRTEMLESILRVQKKYFDSGSMPAFFIAETYGRLGDHQNTLQYLKTSFQRHEVAFLAIRVDQAWTFLHSDPTFQQLVEQAGLPAVR